jgi:hypothetical protein
MRVFAIYDSAGNIRSLAATSHESVQAGRRLEVGEQSATFDVPDLTEYLDPQELNTRLNEIKQTNRVEAEERQPRLVSEG